MRKINLLYVIENLTIGGHQNRVLNECSQLNKNIFNPFMAYSKDGVWRERAESACVKVFKYLNHTKLRNPKNWPEHFVGLWRLVKFIKHNKIDIVITNNSTASFFIGSTAAKITKVASVNIVGASWSMKKLYVRLRRLLPFESYTDKIRVGSRELAKDFVQIGIEPNKIAKINVGIDLQKFHPNNSGKRIREEFGIDDDIAVVGQVSNFYPDKGIGILLKSVAKVIKEIPSVMLMIVGDGPIRKDLELLAQQLGIQQNVIFTGQRKDTPDIIAAFDIAAYPYRGVHSNIPEPGNYGIFTREAIASGKPMIFTDMGAPCEMVKHGVSGFLIPREGVEELSEAIIFLAKNPRKAEEMGLEGRKIAEKELNPQESIRKIEKLYIELAHLKRRGGNANLIDRL